MHKSKENKADELVEMKGIVYKQRRPGLKFKNEPKEELGPINSTGTSVADAAKKIMKKAIKEYGKGISIKLSTQISM